jgi:hypothetical protein
MGRVIDLFQSILLGTEDKDNNNKSSFSYKQTLSYTMMLFSAFVITMVIVLLIGKILWNDYLVEVVPGIKKVDSVFQLAAIFLLTQMLF